MVMMTMATLMIMTLASLTPPTYFLNISTPSTLTSTLTSTQEGYVYYGYVPASNPPEAYLDVVGISDLTNVWVYDLMDGSLITSTAIRRMELYTYIVPSERYLKVVSDKPIAVSISCVRFVGDTFYPSIDGGFAGKEFIFMAFPTQLVLGGTHYGTNTFYAIEDCEVAVYNATGSEVSMFRLSAYSYKDMVLLGRSVYRVVSTGRIMICIAVGNGLTFLPSVTGGFVGNIFFSSLRAWERGALMVFAQKESFVEAVNMMAPSWASALWPPLKNNLKAGQYLYKSLGMDARLVIMGREDISILSGDTQGGDGPQWLGDDIAIAGVKGGEDFYFYAPTKAIVFSPRDSLTIIDNETISMPRDTYIELQAGYHRLKGDQTLILQVCGVDGGFDDWGSYLISPQGVEVSYPQPTSKPPTPNNIVYYLISGLSAAIIFLGVAVHFLRKRRLMKIKESHKP